MGSRVKSFQLFEADINDNKAVSGEYLDDVRRRMQTDSSNSPKMTSEIMMDAAKVGRISKAKSKECVEFVRYVMEQEFGDIIDSMGVVLDLDILTPDEIMALPASQDVEMSPEDGDLDENGIFGFDGDVMSSSLDILEDEGTISDKIDKRKILNNIIQGSAKSIHRIISIYKERLDDIDPSIFPYMDKLLKSNEGFEIDQIINGTDPSEMAKMIGANRTGISYLGGENIQTDSDDYDFGDDDDDTGGIDANDINILYARGLDVVVLLHEAVKALYERISLVGQSSDNEEEELVMRYTDSLEDEFQDLVYGPYIRKDLLSFISDSPNYLSVSNMLEYVFGIIFKIPAKSFITLIRSMLLKTDDILHIEFESIIDGDVIRIRGNARKVIDVMVNNVKQAMDDYNRQVNDYDIESSSDEELDKERDSKISDLFGDVDEDEDLSNMSQKELTALMDDAIDSNDKEKMAEISKFMK